MVNKLGLGTVQFGMDYGISNRSGITSLPEVEEIIKYARTSGIDLIDTAFGYGISEETLGTIGVEDFKIVTKFLPVTPNFSTEDQVKLSLRRLKCDKLYGLLAHRPLDLIDKPELWEYLHRLKESKTIRKIGFSCNNPAEIEMLLERGYFPDIIQVPYNYFDNRFKTYIIDLKSRGCEIQTRSAFLQGLFFMDPDDLHLFFNPVKTMVKKLQENGSSLPGLLLKYCLELPFIDKVIFGVNNRQQLIENIESLKNNKSLPEIDHLFESEILEPSKWPKI